VVVTPYAPLTPFMEYFQVNLMNPKVILGVFIGSMMAFLFCGPTITAVGRAAGRMVEKVRRQFKAKPGIMLGTDTPDYARCVEISTAGAQREMILPSVIAVTVPILVGLVYGVPGTFGPLGGGLSTGFVLAVFMAHSGGAWDNIEEGHHGGKGSSAHKAAVIGETVGDPCKDIAGPSRNSLIKLMGMVSIVTAGVNVAYTFF
jgi:K(+)-stimulated pyrophosphate-energized sodium pump